MPSVSEPDLVMPSREIIKPGVPILLVCALSMWAAQASVLSIAPYEPTLSSLLPILASCVLCILSITGCFIVRKHKGIFLIVSFIFLGVLLAQACAFAQFTNYENLESSQERRVFTLEEDSEKSTFGTTCVASFVSDEGMSIKTRLYLPNDVNLLRSEKISADVRVTKLSEERFIDSFAYGIIAQASIDEFAIETSPLQPIVDLRRRAIDTLQEYAGRSAPILQALICGYRNGIEESGDYDAFKICGCAHIVAVSGAHLAIVAALLDWILKIARIPRILSIGLTSALLVAYLIFAGIPISAVRSAIMVILSVSSFIFGRRGASLNALAICILAFMMMNPMSAISVSLFLSAGSTLGIILFSRLIASWFSVRSHSVEEVVIQPIALTLSSNIATMPFSAALFSQLSLISLPANILAAPLFTLACIAGLIAILISFIFPVATSITISFAALLATPLMWLITFLSSFPYASIAIALPTIPMIVASCVASILLWFWWPRFRAASVMFGLFAIALLVGAFILFPTKSGDRICMLDVGQGDSFLLQSEGASLLVDTGNKDSLLREAIAEHGVHHLDAVIITHPDDDHCASLESLAGYVQIDDVYVAEDVMECGCDKCDDLIGSVESAVGKPPKALKVGTVMNAGKFALEMIWPYEFEDEGGNADSVCFVARIDADGDGDADCTSLFCGDAESEQLERMVESGRLGSIDVLKVGHHGSKVSLNENLAVELSPKVALISAGANNRYGHPSDEVLEQLASIDAAIFRTDKDGCVDINIRGDGISVDRENV